MVSRSYCLKKLLALNGCGGVPTLIAPEIEHIQLVLFKSRIAFIENVLMLPLSTQLLSEDIVHRKNSAINRRCWLCSFHVNNEMPGLCKIIKKEDESD